MFYYLETVVISHRLAGGRSLVSLVSLFLLHTIAGRLHTSLKWRLAAETLSLFLDQW